MTDRQFLDSERQFVGAFSKGVLQSIGFGLNRHKALLLCCLVCNVMGRSALLLTSLLIGFWVDQTLGIASHSYLGQLSHAEFAGLLVSLTLAGFLLSTIYQVGAARVGVSVAMEYHHEAIYRVSRAPLSFFDKNPVGRIFSRFSSDFQNLTRSLGPMLADTVASFVTLILICIFSGVANPWFLPIFVFTTFLNVLIYRSNRPLLRRERRLTAALRAPSFSHFSETVQGFLSIRVFGKHGFFVDRFNQLTASYYYQKIREILVSQSLEMQLRMVAGFSFFTAGMLGVILSYWRLATIGEIGIILTYVGTASGQIQRVCQLMATLEDGLTGAERLDDYLRQPLEPEEVLSESAAYPTAHPIRRPGDCAERLVSPAPLEVRGLSLRYESGPYVLKDIDLKVRAGECLGIVGRTGAGKTSLFQAILKYYPHEGDVLLGGYKVDLFSSRSDKTLSLGDWRECIGFISQHPTLFKGSLRYNLIGDREFSDERLERILDQVGLGHWFRGLPNGLGSIVEEGGKNLSAGQRQLIATARCLLKDASIVLMDEATSAVDPESEERFQHATNVLLRDKTRIIIAHRLSTLKNCDRVLWLKDGGVKLLGPVDAVLQEFRGALS